MLIFPFFDMLVFIREENETIKNIKIEIILLLNLGMAFLKCTKSSNVFEISPTFKHKKPTSFLIGFNSAEKEGFEPPDLLQSTVFKTAAFDRSAISPIRLQSFPYCECKYRIFFSFYKPFGNKK